MRETTQNEKKDNNKIQVGFINNVERQNKTKHMLDK